ncbi:type II secretion system protein [Clostridium sp. AL.422]|uniref:type II secretion system protein n=1 Tax=Clostridium TaxID=1485 RepID=UPI00293DE88B|nr:MULTISPECIES: type II secretion system protein [unclassified Clostridium]MDV4152543.1 type II secretion system protein [Clostridium sp. AL.422]
MKKGSTLVEGIMSMSLLLIALTLCTQIFIISTKSIDLREKKEEANRLSYAIENEIKYNVSFEDINNSFVNGRLSLKYKEDILNSLLVTSLLSLERGNEIVIKREIDNSTEEKYKISTFKITIYNSKWGILDERIFIKSYWMDI